MYQILVYCDSLTWGIIPDTRARLPVGREPGRQAGQWTPTLIEGQHSALGKNPT